MVHALSALAHCLQFLDSTVLDLLWGIFILCKAYVTCIGSINIDIDRLKFVNLLDLLDQCISSLLTVTLKSTLIQILLDLVLEREWIVPQQIECHEELLLKLVPVILVRQGRQSLVPVHQFIPGNPHHWHLLATSTRCVSHPKLSLCLHLEIIFNQLLNKIINWNFNLINNLYI